MNIPISESQLRTYLDTGKVTVDLPSDCRWFDDVEPKEHSKFPGLWMPYCSDGRVANGEPGDTEDSYEITAPVKAGDRVGVGKAWWHYKSDEIEMAGWPGGTVVRRGDGNYGFHRNPEFDPANYNIWTECTANTMPEWAARHHATVATVALERRGDAWAWVVGLERTKGSKHGDPGERCPRCLGVMTVDVQCGGQRCSACSEFVGDEVLEHSDWFEILRGQIERGEK